MIGKSPSNKTHGRSLEPTYFIWLQMHNRCKNPKHRQYRDYGGRGISVCQRWKNYVAFMDDMGPRPDGLTLERVDNSLGYGPDNCHWASHETQNRNTRRNVRIHYLGLSLCVGEWAVRLGIPEHTIHTRLKLGWDAEKALTTPVYDGSWSDREVMFVLAMHREGVSGRDMAMFTGRTKNAVANKICKVWRAHANT